MPPKNMKKKYGIWVMGVALRAVFTRPVRANPMLMKHTAPTVSTSQASKMLPEILMLKPMTPMAASSSVWTMMIQ